MNRNLVAVFVVIVVTPLLVIGWLGARLVRQEQGRAEESLRELMRSTLRQLDAEIHLLLEQRESDLRTAMRTAELDAGSLRRRAARLPLVRQFFVADATTGELVYPSLLDRLSREEGDFLRRTRDLWIEQRLLSSELAEPSEVGPARGWHPWFWGDGLHLLTWWKEAGGRVVGAELDRIRLLSEVIADLPDSDPLDPALGAGRIRLLDATGAVLYQWGAWEPAAGEWPRVRQPLSPPLAVWTLEYFGAEAPSPAAAVAVLPWISVLLAVVGLAVYFYRESSREIREAVQRVSFVNQVSHELKTPLTNVRMYAELLDDELDDGDEAARRFLGVIVSESQRLSRLILNILTFSRRQRQELTLRPSIGIVDDAVAAVVDQFRPSFELHDLAVDFSPSAPRTASFDVDVVQQILGNLLSNVEKYAATGERVEVTTRQQGDEVVLVVGDRGPGIPQSERERIFEPFYRISNALSDGVTGTGIGLSLVRDLARVHGGDVGLLPAEQGAWVRITLHCPEEEP